MNFVDRVRVRCRGGDGGAGVVSFERQKGRPRGKPNGGSGGDGGDIVLVADAGVASLLSFVRRPQWQAGDGSHGQGDLRHGASGADLDLPVPLGTTVLDDDGDIIADLVEPGQGVTVARGGRGGKGNAAFVSVQRRAPAFSEQGEYGSEAWIELELKVIADAALVGYPNAGKSTLIARASAARPKIADYPFTTLTPNLGVVALGDREFVLADVPGLIAGAASGKGLGHEFLRHVERAGVLVILLDPTDVQSITSAEQYEILLDELSQHSLDLIERPRVVVLNKVDVVADLDEHMAWAESAGIVLHPISAVTGQGVEALLFDIADEVDRRARQAPDRPGFLLHRPLTDQVAVARNGDTWIVEGRAAERAVNLDDLTVPEAADFVASRLARIGVDEALLAAGASPGDDVRIGEMVFTFDPDAAADADMTEDVAR
jgi:GTP-binding protein